MTEHDDDPDVIRLRELLTGHLSYRADPNDLEKRDEPPHRRMRDDFVVLILSHGRAASLRKNTVTSLLRAGYTGDWFIVLDSGDDTYGEYEQEFGAGRLVTFDKKDSDTDMGDNGGSSGVIIYARNAAAKIAKSMGYRYYMQLDDDYTQWMHRYPEAREDGTVKLGYTNTRRIDMVLAALVDLLEDTGALTVAMAQGGDLIGGLNSVNYRRGLLRKAMNTFIARTDRPLHFVGRINEDVNTYVTESMRGEVLLTFVDFQIVQVQSQKSEGGMSTAYLAGGTYMKSFYTVMMAPSAVSISTMGVTGHRIHHHVKWDNVAPKIVSDRYRKAR